MAGSRSAPSRAGNSPEWLIRSNVDAIARLRAAGFDPRAFVLAQGSRDTGEMVAVVKRHWGRAKPSLSYPSLVDTLQRLSPISRPIPPNQPPQGAWESVKAGFRGAQDSLPFELGDYLPAAAVAMGASAMGDDPIGTFHHRLAAEREQNRYDQAFHPTARTVGKVAGSVAQVAVPGMALARAANGAKLAQAAPLAFGETAKLTALGGAASGVGAQALNDIGQGRLGSLGDYGGSAFGGVTGSLAARYGGSGFGGGVTGGASSLAQDFLNGRVGSVEEMRSAAQRAADAASSGSLFATPVGRGVGRWSDRLPSFRPKDGSLSKGQLGEWLSRQRTRLRGEEVAALQVRTPVQGGHTVVDHLERGGGAIEAKFGKAARLSRRQRQAYHEMPNYRVDHFLPNDLAAVAEVPAGALAYQLYDDGYPQY